MLHIVFGTDIDHIKIMMEVRESPKEPYKKIEVGLYDATGICASMTLGNSMFRLANPIWKLAYRATGKSYAFTKAQRIADKNCERLRQEILRYIRQRKNGTI